MPRRRGASDRTSLMRVIWGMVVLRRRMVRGHMMGRTGPIRSRPWTTRWHLWRTLERHRHSVLRVLGRSLMRWRRPLLMRHVMRRRPPLMMRRHMMRRRTSELMRATTAWHHHATGRAVRWAVWASEEFSRVRSGWTSGMRWSSHSGVRARRRRPSLTLTLKLIQRLFSWQRHNRALSVNLPLGQPFHEQPHGILRTKVHHAEPLGLSVGSILEELYINKVRHSHVGDRISDVLIRSPPS